MQSKIINGQRYFRISELALASGINIRTLQRWVKNGDFVNHLTTYQTPKGMKYFRLGLPSPQDQLVAGSTFIYRLPTDEIN